MRKHILLFLLFLSTGWLLAENLFINTVFTKDTDGRIAFWSDVKGAVEVLPFAGPNDLNAVKLDMTKTVEFAQKDFIVVPGEPYRLGGYVRTRDFKSSRATLSVWDFGPWEHEVHGPAIPANATEWTLIEAVIKAPVSKTGLYAGGVVAIKATGDLQVAGLFLEPLSDKAKAGSKSTPDLVSNRIAPVSHLLSRIPEGKNSFRFRYPLAIRDFQDKSKAAYLARVQLSVNGSAVLEKEIAMSSEDFVFTVDKLEPGRGELRLSVAKDGKTVAESSYPVTVLPQVPTPKFRQKRLNNVVTELLSAPLSNGAVDFFNPREGWIYVGFQDANSEATATLDGEARPMVSKGIDGEPFDGFRYLPKGAHKLLIAGASRGKLVVRTIPETLVYPFFIIYDGPSAYNKYTYNLDFHRKYMFHAFNTFNIAGGINEKDKATLEAYGIRHIGSYRFSELAWRDDALMLKELKKSWAYRTTQGCTLDELDSNASSSIKVPLVRALWQLQDEDFLLYTWICGSTPLRRKNTDTDVLAAASNVSKGRGKIIYETYVVTRNTPEEMEQCLANLKNYAHQQAPLVDDALGKTIFTMTGLLEPGDWTCHVHPQVDLKYYFDRFFQVLSTEKDFQGLYGFGCYNYYHTDEEMVRWIAALQRHYGIEGNTSLLSDKYGFTYIPGLLQDGDFKEGLAKWNAVPAEKDAILAASFPQYAEKFQGRRTVFGQENNGDTVACFKRSAKAPNTLSQTIRGLVPGKLYKLGFVVADKADVVARKITGEEKPVFAMKASLDKADVIPDVSYVRIHSPRKQGKGIPLNIHKILFRARAAEVTVTFSDWDDTVKNAPAGQELLLNFVNVAPYFEN